MKVKKVILYIMLSISSMMHTGIMYHSMISVTEQKMLGHVFKHVMTSGNLEKDEFFIDGVVVTKENYSKEFDRIQKKELDEIAAQQESQRRSRIQFSEMMQIEVVAKLLQKVVVQTVDLLHRVDSPTLEKFFVFHEGTVNSLEQLHQLRIFLDQVQISMKKRIESNDFESLNILYNKLEVWPARLEKFFQETVQQAIRQSDDTAMLKELLLLVS